MDKNKIPFSRVSLSLENCILPQEKLYPTPSQNDGLDQESEIELRILGCEMIQVSGVLLKLPQVAMATGQVLFQRFFYSKSFVRQPMEVVAMACITLASKIEEAPRRIRDVINVCHHIKQMKAGKTIQPLVLDINYIDLKNKVIKAERRVLKELGFCVHVKHPHKIIVTLLEVLKVKNRRLMQTAWNYMNDSLRTEVFVRYDPEKIACACIHLSARVLQFPLPNKPAWYLVFGVSDDEINDISQKILSLYCRKKPDPERLEKLIEHLKKTHLEAKLKAKGIPINNSLVNSSQPGSPRNGTKSPGSDGKKEKNDKHNDVSPKYHKDSNHRKRRSASPDRSDDLNNSSDTKKRSKSSSSASTASRSPSPKRNKKTPPRGFKEAHRSRSRSRSKTRTSKPKKHRSSHKRKRSRSASPTSPATHHSAKSASKSNSTSKSSKHSKSSHHDRNHNSTASTVHESSKDKSSSSSHKSRRTENHHSSSSSRDKKRR